MARGLRNFAAHQVVQSAKQT